MIVGTVVQWWALLSHSKKFPGLNPVWWYHLFYTCELSLPRDDPNTNDPNRKPDFCLPTLLQQWSPQSNKLSANIHSQISSKSLRNHNSNSISYSRLNEGTWEINNPSGVFTAFKLVVSVYLGLCKWKSHFVSKRASLPGHPHPPTSLSILPLIGHSSPLHHLLLRVAKLSAVESSSCMCRTPCNMTRYNKELSMVKIPSKTSARYLQKKFNKTEKYITWVADLPRLPVVTFVPPAGCARDYKYTDYQFALIEW